MDPMVLTIPYELYDMVNIKILTSHLSRSVSTVQKAKPKTVTFISHSFLFEREMNETLMNVAHTSYCVLYCVIIKKCQGQLILF